MTNTKLCRAHASELAKADMTQQTADLMVTELRRFVKDASKNGTQGAAKSI